MFLFGLIGILHRRGARAKKYSLVQAQLLVQAQGKSKCLVSCRTSLARVHVCRHNQQTERDAPLGPYSTEQHTPSSNVHAARQAQGYTGTAHRLNAASLKDTEGNSLVSNKNVATSLHPESRNAHHLGVTWYGS